MFNLNEYFYFVLSCNESNWILAPYNDHSVCLVCSYQQEFPSEKVTLKLE